MIITKVYFGHVVRAIKKGDGPYPWMFEIDTPTGTKCFAGIPNKCARPRQALKRAWYRAKWLAEGTYDQRYV